MNMSMTKLTFALLACSVLFGLTACTGTPMKNSPNMVDYSYVPQSSHMTVLSNPGIESF